MPYTSKTPVRSKQKPVVSLSLLAMVAALSLTGFTANAGAENRTQRELDFLARQQAYDQNPDSERTATQPASSTPRLRWEAPMKREDGTSLYPGEISGYRIYVSAGTEDRARVIPIDDGSATSYALKEVSPGTYSITISVVDADGRESRQSPSVRVEVS